MNLERLQDKKSTVFLDTSSEKSKNEIKETIPLIVVSKSIKHLILENKFNKRSIKNVH